jgi:predicted CoA-substrate-specific enzyme activase
MRWSPIFCSLIPREVLLLAGRRPVEIQPPEAPDHASGCECALCDNLCSWVRHLAGRLLAGDADSSVVVVPVSCDAMSKLHDVLAASGRDGVFRLPVPRRNDEAGIRYLAGQYVRLLGQLGIDESNFDEVRARHAVPAASGNDAVARQADAPRVGLAGSVYPERHFRTVLEEAGAQVHVLRRCGMAVPGPLPDSLLEGSIHDFCRRLAAHYLGSAVCPRMMTTRMTESLAAEVAARRLAALVVPVLEFCDGYHLAVDDLLRCLPAGFPLLLVEGDLTSGFGEQTVTRLEAFMERVRGDIGKRPARPVDRSRYVVGIDVGSTQVKAVLMDAEGRLAGTSLCPTGGRMVESSRDAVAQLLSRAGVDRAAVAAVSATGYGRKSVACDATRTEIACHARGVSRTVTGPVTVIDIGGQDSKVIVTGGNGQVLRFSMNDKCAAGTGRFIDAMVRTLGLDMGRFSALSLEAAAEVPVTSMCSVFAESEVISLTARSEPLSGVARGINASIARRVAGMVRRAAGAPPFVLTGGVSQIPGFVSELERELGEPVRVFEHALHAGAIGAAMLVIESAP